MHVPKTISQNFALALLLSLIFSFGCTSATPQKGSGETSTGYEKPREIGRIKNTELGESSGIAASYCQEGVLWTHNDSGNDAAIYAMTTDGKDLGKWIVPNARNIDWEDIAASKDADGRCYIYIGDIGDNKLSYIDYSVYRIPEPRVGDADLNGNRKTAEPQMLRFRYPDGPHNAEALLQNPLTGAMYVLTKRVDGPAGVYRLSPRFEAPETVVAEKVGEVAVPSIPNGLLTGGSISPDGKRVIISDYTNGYELTLPDQSTNFDEIWTQTPAIVDLGNRKQGEAVTYTADGRSILAVSEGKRSKIFKIDAIK